MTPTDAKETIGRAIDASDIGYNDAVLTEPNYFREHNRLVAPWYVIQLLSSVPDNPHDSRVVGFEFAADGTFNGVVRKRIVELSLQIRTVVPEQSGDDAQEMGIETELLLDTYGTFDGANEFRDEDGNTLTATPLTEGVEYFGVNTSSPTPELSGEVSLRKYETDLTMRISTVSVSEEALIDIVETPPADVAPEQLTDGRAETPQRLPARGTRTE